MTSPTHQTYKILLHCSNCEHIWEATVPKGKEVQRWIVARFVKGTKGPIDRLECQNTEEHFGYIKSSMDHPQYPHALYVGWTSPDYHVRLEGDEQLTLEFHDFECPNCLLRTVEKMKPFVCTNCGCLNKPD